MPAARRLELPQVHIYIRPAWWLRRWTHFPLYFQAFRTTFHLFIKRIREDTPTNLTFAIKFSDNTHVSFPVDVSNLAVGETLKYEMTHFVFTSTGDTQIVLNQGRSDFYTLYAFVVSPEATLVFLLLNIFLAGLLTLLLRV